MSPFIKLIFLYKENQSCEICKNRLISNDLSAARKLIIFECKHAYHETCLPKELAVSFDFNIEKLRN
jgi:hypothetical protein